MEEFRRVCDCVNFPDVDFTGARNSKIFRNLSPLLTFVFLLYFDHEIDRGTDDYSKGFSIYLFIFSCSECL